MASNPRPLEARSRTRRANQGCVRAGLPGLRVRPGARRPMQGGPVTRRSAGKRSKGSCRQRTGRWRPRQTRPPHGPRRGARPPYWPSRPIGRRAPSSGSGTRAGIAPGCSTKPLPRRSSPKRGRNRSGFGTATGRAGRGRQTASCSGSAQSAPTRIGRNPPATGRGLSAGLGRIAPEKIRARMNRRQSFAKIFPLEPPVIPPTCAGRGRHCCRRIRCCSSGRREGPTGRSSAAGSGPRTRGRGCRDWPHRE